MKKAILIFAGIFVLAAVLAVTGFAYAQTQTPPSGDTDSAVVPGWGMMGRNAHGMMRSSGNGPLHGYMEEALAEKLGLSEAEIEEKLASGETMWSIAQAQGLTDEQITELMQSARDEALKAAVAAGAITQEQADWMSQRMQQMHGAGMGAGGCGAGFGQGSRQRMPMGRWFNQP